MVSLAAMVATAAAVREMQVGPPHPQLGVEHRKEDEEGHAVEDPAAGLRVTGALGVAFYQLSMPEESRTAFCGFDKDSHHTDSNGRLKYGELCPRLASPQPLSPPPSPWAASRRPHAVSGARVLGKSYAHTASAARVVSKSSPQLHLTRDGVPTGSVDQCVQSIRRRRGVRLEARPAEERWEKAQKAERKRDLVPPPATLGLHAAKRKTSQAKLKISQVGSAQARTRYVLVPALSPPPFPPTTTTTIIRPLFYSAEGNNGKPLRPSSPSPYTPTRPRPNPLTPTPTPTPRP